MTAVAKQDELHARNSNWCETWKLVYTRCYWCNSSQEATHYTLDDMKWIIEGWYEVETCTSVADLWLSSGSGMESYINIKLQVFKIGIINRICLPCQIQDYYSWLAGGFEVCLNFNQRSENDWLHIVRLSQEYQTCIAGQNTLIYNTADGVMYLV